MQQEVNASDVDKEVEVEHEPRDSSVLFDDLLPQDLPNSKVNNHFELNSHTPSMPQEHDKLLRMDLDAMLKKLGQFGKFQIICLTLLLFPLLLDGYQCTDYIFITMNIPHRCRVPECEGTIGSTQFSPEWLNRTVPFSKHHKPQFCLRYRSQHNATYNSNCPADLFDTNVTQSCNDWVFSEPTRTIAQDFNILCPEDFWKLTLLGSFTVLTTIVGLPLVGFFSDRFGRKTVLVYSAVLTSFISILRSFSMNYEILASLQFLQGLVSGAVFGAAFILGMETLSDSKRLLGSMLISTYFAVGEALLGFVMWLVQDWRILLRVFYIPMMGMVALHWLLPESVRWLYTQGRFDDVEAIFKKIARENKTEDCLSNVISDLRAQKPKKDTDVAGSRIIEDTVKSVRLNAVLNSRIIMRRFIACALGWIATLFTYYGISQNATYISGGNRYMTFILVSLVEVPAYVASLWVPDWPFLGRRGSTAGSLLIGGVACLALNLFSFEHQWINMLLFLIAKFISTLTSCFIYLYTAELFPTEVRLTLLSTCSMVGRIGTILSQQMRLVEMYVDPNLVFGIVSLVGGVAILTCPETLGTTLPDTIEEAEKIGRKTGRHSPPSEQRDVIELKNVP